MFRPFLPGGFAYGFAYGIPCSFSGGRHPAGLFVLYHIGAVLVNRFRQNFGGICLFPAPGGCPRVGGDCSGVAGSAGVGGALRGRAFFVAYPAFSLLYRPLSPRPPSPAGKGETKVIFMQGASPLASPGLDGTRHWLCLWKTDSCGFKWNVGTRRGGEPGLQKAATAVHLYGRVYKCRKRFSAGVPGAKPPAK